MPTEIRSWPGGPATNWSTLSETPLFKLLQPTWLSQPLLDGSWLNLAPVDIEKAECGPLIFELQEINRADLTRGADPLNLGELISALNCSASSDSFNPRYPAATALWVVLLRFRALDHILSRWKPRYTSIMPPDLERPQLPSFPERLKKASANKFVLHSYLHFVNVAFEEP